jgi:hypothetical protein
VPRAHREGRIARSRLLGTDERSGITHAARSARVGEKRDETPSRAPAVSRLVVHAARTARVRQRRPFKTVYSREDLFRSTLARPRPTATNARRRLTEAAPSSGDVSPDGRQVAFTVNTKGTTYLQIADLTAEGALARRRDLVPSGQFEQAYTPRFSPDGKHLAYSAWTAGGYRDIRLVEVATGRYRRITHDRAIDMHPVFSSDGETLFFVSDRTGIANVTRTIRARHAQASLNVRLGVPAGRDEDGKTLVYTGYTPRPDLYVPLEPARWLDALGPDRSARSAHRAERRAETPAIVRCPR